MRFSETEISQLAKSWIVISLAFAIVWRDIPKAYGLSFGYIYVISALTVGIAFVVHELGHKYLAERMGCWAEFRSFNMGLILALVFSVIGGIVFAAPGAVMISGSVTREENGKIAAIGPVINLVLAGLFYLVGYFLPIGAPLVSLFISIGFNINAWLAFFNLIPIGPLDGAKVLRWSPVIWILLFIISAGATFWVG
jgi:Zn-dependent protease